MDPRLPSWVRAADELGVSSELRKGKRYSRMSMSCAGQRSHADCKTDPLRDPPLFLPLRENRGRLPIALVLESHGHAQHLAGPIVLLDDRLMLRDDERDLLEEWREERREVHRRGRWLISVVSSSFNALFWDAAVLDRPETIVQTKRA